MKTAVLEYVTQEGDRWDNIAYAYYGDAMLYEPIIAANANAPIIPILPSGIRLYIPIIDDSDLVGTEGLPPWKA